MTDPLIRSTQYTMTEPQIQLTVQNPKDSSISYTLAYDVANQLKTITYSDGVTPNVSVQYDPDGHGPRWVTARHNNLTYDSLHRLIQTTNAPGLKLLMAMNPKKKGNVTKMLYPGGQTSSPGPTMTLAGLRQ